MKTLTILKLQHRPVLNMFPKNKDNTLHTILHLTLVANCPSALLWIKSKMIEQWLLIAKKNSSFFWDSFLTNYSWKEMTPGDSLYKKLYVRMFLWHPSFPCPAFLNKGLFYALTGFLPNKTHKDRKLYPMA